MTYNKNVVHEGAIKDIVDLILNDKFSNTFGKIFDDKNKYFSNIAKKTSNLVLTFPVIADESVSLSTAKLMAKATERKVVGMLQMLFAAMDITNNTDAFEFVGKVHQNLTSDDVISFINKMDVKNLKHENLDIDTINKIMIECISEDTIELNNELPVPLNDSFSVKANNVIVEDKDLNGFFSKFARETKKQNRNLKAQNQKLLDQLNDKNKEMSEKLAEKDKEINERLNSNKIRASHTDQSFLKDQILSSDLKKANDDVPSLLIVRFVQGNGDMKDKIVTQAIIGVKAKLVYVKQSDMINRIITKNRDNNGLFNFLRATTGEISMIKDFLFAIDRAKLDTISSRNNSSPIWKLLERRYLMSKKNWLLRNSNGAGTAIAVLVMSKETEDILNKDYGFKCEPYKMLEIMEAYSVMGIAIVDDVNEKVKSLYDDNSTQYEINSYSSYEKEDKNQFKKMINLMTGAKEKL